MECMTGLTSKDFPAAIVIAADNEEVLGGLGNEQLAARGTRLCSGTVGVAYAAEVRRTAIDRTDEENMAFLLLFNVTSDDLQVSFIPCQY